MDDKRGFGGFTFVNNGPAQGGDEAAITPSTRNTEPTHRVPNTLNAGNQIPPGQQGNSPFNHGLDGRRQRQVLFWVASQEAVASDNWACYLLSLSAEAGGIRVTSVVQYDRLADRNACTVEIQTRDAGVYTTEAEPDVMFTGFHKPDFSDCC